MDRDYVELHNLDIEYQDELRAEEESAVLDQHYNSINFKDFILEDPESILDYPEIKNMYEKYNGDLNLFIDENIDDIMDIMTSDPNLNSDFKNYVLSEYM